MDRRHTVCCCDFVNQRLAAHWKKVENLKKFMDSSASSYISDDDYVIFSDGTDVMYVDDIGRARTVFEEYYMKEIASIDVKLDQYSRWPVVFSAEKNRYVQ